MIFVPAALAQTLPPSDVSISSVGVQTWTSSALGATDADVALAERLRWTIAGDSAGVSATRLLADARFTLDPTGGDPAFEWSSVRQLGVEHSRRGFTLSVGRHPVYQGGPRLVDGLQVLVRPTERLDLGVWTGLQPDLFTTLPRLRPAAGPVVSYSTSRLQASVVGDVSLYEGELDRAGVLSMLRLAAERTIEGAIRVDAELAGLEGARLVDGSAVAVLTPIELLRFDAMYDAFSSYLYQNSTDLDPDLQRFVARAGALGGTGVVLEETRDPRLNHLVGGMAQVEPRTQELAPRVRLTVRQRFHPDEENRYFRLNPQVGMLHLGGALDLLLDGNYLVVDEGTQLDGGLMGVWAPGDGTVAFDGSFRLVRAPDELEKLGTYGDLYLDVVSQDAGLLITAGGSVTSEPDILDQQDTGFGAYLRVSKFVRPANKARPPLPPRPVP